MSGLNNFITFHFCHFTTVCGFQLTILQSNILSDWYYFVQKLEV